MMILDPGDVVRYLCKTRRRTGTVQRVHENGRFILVLKQTQSHWMRAADLEIVKPIDA